MLVLVERETAVIVDRLPWVRAVITESDGAELLTTWRSSKVPDGHTMLAPLTVLTDEIGCELLFEEFVLNDEFFGQTARVTTWTLPDVTKGDVDVPSKKSGFDG